MTLRFPSAAVLALFAFSLLLAGCGSPHVAYHSTASVPFYTASTSTQMEAIERTGDQVTQKNYVVFAALDNQNAGYVLLAPTGGTSFESNFKSADFDRAVPLKGENLSSFISGLGDATKDWGEEREGTGTFYEFVHAPEDDIQRVSKNVIEYYASVRFTLSRTPDGTAGRLVLGASPDKQLQSVISFEDKEDVQTLRNLLKRARERSTGMQEARSQRQKARRK